MWLVYVSYLEHVNIKFGIYYFKVSYMSRLKLERKRLGLSQSDVYGHLDVSRSSYIRWESGAPIPSDKLVALEELNFDVCFVLTGRSERSLNTKALEYCIERLEAILDENDAEMPPRAKSKLIAYFYEVYMDEGEVDDDNLVRHIRLVS